MRPRLLTDEMILSAIADLSARGRVTGVSVYQFLQAANRPAPTAVSRSVPPADPRALEDALARVALAEERERVHQTRWARENDGLRARLQQAEQSARDVPALRLKIAELQRALGAAQRRIQQLEMARPADAPADLSIHE